VPLGGSILYGSGVWGAKCWRRQEKKPRGKNALAKKKERRCRTSGETQRIAATTGKNSEDLEEGKDRPPRVIIKLYQFKPNPGNLYEGKRKGKWKSDRHGATKLGPRKNSRGDEGEKSIVTELEKEKKYHTARGKNDAKRPEEGGKRSARNDALMFLD